MSVRQDNTEEHRTRNRRSGTARRGFLVVLAAVLCAASATAQLPRDSSFAIVAYAGGGVAQYLTAISPPADIRSSVHRGGASFTLRVMWHPDHLLRAGIESGWYRVYSYTLHAQSDGNLYLSAIPLLLVFSMPLSDRWNVFAGVGGYFVKSRLDFGSVVTAYEFSQGWMAAASYAYPLSSTLDLSAEVKWLNASQFEDANLTAQVHLVWHVFTW